MERWYKLHNGDVFTVSIDLFLSVHWDTSKFKFIQCNYFLKPWWKFWKKRKIKSVTIMYIGKDIQNDYLVTNEKKCVEEFYKNDQN